MYTIFSGSANTAMSKQARTKRAQKGGKATVAKHGLQFYRKIGQAGGKKAQNEGSAHKLTNEERSRGGKH